MSDNEQAAQPMTRQRAALAELIETHQQALGSYLTHLIGEPELARALTVETFLCAHRAQSEIRPDRTVRPWLYRIATELAYRQLRRRSVVRLSDKGAEADVTRGVLGELQPSDRAVLLLCDLDQLPFSEAATIVGVSVERLQHRLARARARFRVTYLARHSLVRTCRAGRWLSN